MNARTLSIFASTMVMVTSATATVVTFAVSPSAISNTYTGLITLDIGGLTNGEQVMIQKYLDVNGNGVVDPGEPLADSFRIMDGGAMVIGGITNINVPFDRNPAPGAITTTLNLTPPRILGNLVGQFVFVLSSPGQRFSPLTATLTITNAALAQSISGVVYSNGVVPMPNAVVVALQNSNGGGRWAGGAVADGAGHYQLSLNPGSYVVFPAMPGYVTDQSLGAQLNLTNGISSTNSLYLTNATETISGGVTNAANGTGVAGIMMPVEGGNYLTIAFTDTNGTFTAAVVPGQWKVKVDADAVNERAFVVPQNKVQVDTTTGSVANVSIPLWKANALFYGTFSTSGGQPFSNLGLFGSDQSGLYEASGFTDSQGHYCVAVLGGTNTWWCSPDNQDPVLSSYIISSFNGTTITGAMLQNFTALPATASIAGQLVDNHGNPVSGIGINANAAIGGVAYGAYVRTDQNGYFTLSAASGVWQVNANCCGSDGLDSRNFEDPLQHTVTIPPTNAVLNITVYPYGTPFLSQPGSFGPNTFGMNLSGAPGMNYIIQATTNLSSPNWFTVLQVTNLSGNFFYLQDNQATNGQRFYRALLVP